MLLGMSLTGKQDEGSPHLQMLQSMPASLPIFYIQAHAHDLNHFLHNEGLFLRYVGFASSSLPPKGSLRLMDLHATQKKHLLY